MFFPNVNDTIIVCFVKGFAIFVAQIPNNDGKAKFN